MNPTQTREQKKAAKRAKQKPETPAQRARRLQEQNTREASAIRTIERTNRVINPVLLTISPIPALLLHDAIKEKDREIVRLRRALVATQVRLERTTGSLIPKLRSKVNEVRDLRSKLYPENITGRKRSKREVARDRKDKETTLKSQLPRLNDILANNEAAAQAAAKNGTVK